MKTIQKLSKAKFKLSTDNVPNSDLELDFNPIIDNFNLKGDYLLLHFQAKPKESRQWGVYASKTDSYHSIKEFDLDRPQARSLHLDETRHKTVPTAVLLIENARLILVDDCAKFCTTRTLIDVSGDSL